MMKGNHLVCFGIILSILLISNASKVHALDDDDSGSGGSASGGLKAQLDDTKKLKLFPENGKFY